jgi:hypothetical protein
MVNVNMPHTNQDKEIVDKFWKEWQGDKSDYSKYDMDNWEFVERTFLQGIAKGRSQLAEEVIEDIAGKHFYNGIRKKLQKELQQKEVK